MKIIFIDGPLRALKNTVYHNLYLNMDGSDGYYFDTGWNDDNGYRIYRWRDEES